MIFTERKITVTNDTAKIDRPLILYRGDKNIELKITIAESQFKFRNNDASNVIETTDASYAQLIINTPYGLPIFSDVAATKNGAVIFVITEGMVDEIKEIGSYDIQIRLLDDNKQSRATIPPVSNAIEIKDPIAMEDGSAIDGNTVNTAMVNHAVTTYSTPLEPFDSQGNYIKTTWGEGDLITDAKLNKIEAGIEGVNKKVVNAGGSGEVDLSGYVTKETGNANQITFADGETFQSKLDAGTLKGDTGPQGPAGADGQVPNITIGTVTTLEAGNNATAEITGTTPDLTLNLGIPKGADGAGGTGSVTDDVATNEEVNTILDNIFAGGVN